MPYMGKQIKDKNTLLEILNDYENDDNRQKMKQNYPGTTNDQNKRAPVQETTLTSSQKEI